MATFAPSDKSLIVGSNKPIIFAEVFAQADIEILERINGQACQAVVGIIAFGIKCENDLS